MARGEGKRRGKKRGMEKENEGEKCQEIRYSENDAEGREFFVF